MRAVRHGPPSRQQGQGALVDLAAHQRVPLGRLGAGQQGAAAGFTGFAGLPAAFELRFGPPGSDNEVSLTALSLKGRYADFHADKFRREPDLYLGVRIGW